MTWTVTFHNPGMNVTVTREFATKEEAEARVAHYERKYGKFPGYSPAVIIPPATP